MAAVTPTFLSHRLNFMEEALKIFRDRWEPAVQSGYDKPSNLKFRDDGFVEECVADGKFIVVAVVFNENIRGRVPRKLLNILPPPPLECSSNCNSKYLYSSNKPGHSHPLLNVQPKILFGRSQTSGQS
jgi:hypothetical protein